MSKHSEALRNTRCFGPEHWEHLYGLIKERDQLLETLKLCESNISSLAAAHPKIYSEWLAVVSAEIVKATHQ